MATKTNTDVPAPRQVWEHHKTEHRLLIIRIKNDVALCALIDHKSKVTPRRLLIAASKFKFWGNRGFVMVDPKRTGKLPAPGKEAGVYNTRNAYLGAK